MVAASGGDGTDVPGGNSGRMPGHALLGGTVFISYDSEHVEWARTLCAQLAQVGVSTWLDREQIPPGADWRASIAAAIRGRATVGYLFLIGPRGVTREQLWEWERIKQARGPRLVVPVLLPEAESRQVPDALRGRRPVVLQQ